MNFPQIDFNVRERIRVSYRGLLMTNSVNVEFSDLQGRVSFPMAYACGNTGQLPAGTVWVIPFELDGWIYVNPGSLWEEYASAPFKRFEFTPPASTSQGNLFVAPVTLTVTARLVAGALGSTTLGPLYQPVQLTFSDGTIVRYAEAPALAGIIPMGATLAQIAALGYAEYHGVITG